MDSDIRRKNRMVYDHQPGSYRNRGSCDGVSDLQSGRKAALYGISKCHAGAGRAVSRLSPDDSRGLRSTYFFVYFLRPDPQIYELCADAGTCHAGYCKRKSGSGNSRRESGRIRRNCQVYEPDGTPCKGSDGEGTGIGTYQK